MLEIIKISKQKLIPNNWNGGKTFEYLIYPANSNYTNRDFDFRISCATIEKIPSEFTRFAGYTRYLIMLDNSLEIKRNSSFESIKKNKLFKFNSNDEVTSFSIGNDFNFMISSTIKKHEIRLVKGNFKTNAKKVILFALEETEIILNDLIFILDKNECLFLKKTSNSFNKMKMNHKLIAIKI